MRTNHRWLAPGLITLLLLAGCAKRPAVPSAPAPSPTPAPAADSTPAAPKSMVDTLNDLSYTNLQAGRWKEAEQAANEALKREPGNPAALYNAGMALLGQKRYDEALSDLMKSSAGQPDRYEPYLGLARAFEESGEYALAAFTAEQALRYGKADPETAKRAQSVAQMRERSLAKAPAGVLTACSATLKAPDLTLCVHPDKDGWQRSPYDLWAVQADGKTEHFPLGTLKNMWKVPVQPVQLPGGATGYLLEGPEEYDGATEWRLFIRTADGLRQVVFAGNSDQELLPLTDFVYSATPPVLQASTLIALHRSRDSKQRPVRVSYQLDYSTGVATQLALESADGVPAAPKPVLTLDQAFAAVGEVPYVASLANLLRSKFIEVHMKDTGARYHISVGENQTSRVRFDSHWQVSKTTGAVWWD